MRIRFSGIAAASLILFWGGARAAVLVDIIPGSQTVAPGSPVTVDLDISGLGSGTALGAFDIDINFSTSLLSFKSATFGDPLLGDQLDLGKLGLNGPTATPAMGTVDLIEADLFDSPATLLASQAHSFTLAVLSFSALSSGTMPLTITLNSLADQNSLAFSASTQNGSLTVATPVPEPGTGGLALLGLAAAALARRGRKARPDPSSTR